MGVSYATRADLLASEFVPAGVVIPEDPEASRLLTAASRRVDALLIAAVYEVDDTGAPVARRVAEALRDAACAQAVWWLLTGDESGTAGLYQRVAIGSVQLDRGSSPARDPRGPATAPQAVQALQLAGLIIQGPWVF